ncbi:MAG: hypothetical protein K6T30_03830 [Alicyclobacillus sp.]|nr:hypothetical protein [Alicyclobacillus sp.]
MREELLRQTSFRDANIVPEGSWLAVDEAADQVVGFVVVGLLALTLQDLADGRIHVGHGSARGHGQLWIETPPELDDLKGCVKALWCAVGLVPPEGAAAR